MTPPLPPALTDRFASLGRVPPPALTDARRVLHWAAQPVAALGFSVLPAREDYGHTALRWRDADGALCSQPHPATGLHAALHPEPFALTLREGDAERSRLDLAGQTLEQAYAWLGEALAHAGVPLHGPVVRPGHIDDLPAHPVAEGAAFEAPPPAHRRELAAWLAAAEALLQEVKRQISGLGEIQCWPHHFDTAALHVLRGEGESMRSVGVGLSPGDDSYPQPYVYVTPWPCPTGVLPELPTGHWHTEGWTGAVLLARSLLEVPAERRAATVLEMIHAAHDRSVERLLA